MKKRVKCFVPKCPNASYKTPDKAFVLVIDILKQKWCQLLNISYNPQKRLYCCEDHLNLETDLQNYFQWKFMKTRPRLKPTANLQCFSNMPSTSGESETQAEASLASSSRQSNTSTSQHARAATRRTSSPATDDDDGPDDAELFGDHNIDGSMDCIKTSTKTETSTKIKTCTKTEMTTKTKPTTNTTPTKKTKTTIAIPAAEISGDDNYRCNVCSGSIVGFRYTCVQCAHYSHCASCEARGEHSLHYMLRIPRLAKKAEVAAMLSKIRTHLLYGLETEEAEQETDDRVVPVLPVEFEIKTEIKEELPDPLEHEDVFQPEDLSYTEPEYIARVSTSKEKTLTPAPVNSSSMIVTETEGNYVIIENPVKSKPTKTKPKTTKHKNTTNPEVTQHNGSEKRMKIYLEEQTQVIETMMDVPVDTAGPPTEGASWELPVIVKTEEEDEDSFQVLSHSPHRILEDKPGPGTGMTKLKAKSTSKKKVV